MKAILTFFVAWIIVIGAHSKTISGVVTSNLNGQVLSGVHVQNGQKSNVFTDENGRYTIEATKGDYLEFTYPGYMPYKVKVGKDEVINVALEGQIQYIDEIVVSGANSSTAHVLQKQVAGLVPAGGSSTFIRGKVYFSGKESVVNRESYASMTENKFLSPLKEPLSTFGADVDAASYNNIKRFIRGGMLPPVDAVRVEEMINYFQYDVKGPSNNDPVNIVTELTNSPWSNEHQLLRITLKAKDIPTEKLPLSNFVFLIDISGSMSSANKLPLVKSSYKLLVDQLRAEDRVAIVTYAGNANVALESISGDKKMKIKEVIDGLQAGGSTAGGDGLKMAYNIARQHFIKHGNNRIVMATDGDFNVGASSDDDMEKLIAKERESGVNISILGYGMGNYKDSKLETLANKGRGNYGYINDIAEARKAIINEFGGTMFTVAKDVKIQVEFNPAYVRAYRLVGYENRLMAAEYFNNDSKVGGDMGVGHTVTAVYEIVPAGVKSNIIGEVDPLKYQENKKQVQSNNAVELATVKFRYKDPNAEKSKLKSHVVVPKVLALDKVSDDFKFITAIAEMGMLLRNSEYKQGANFEKLITRAKAAKGKDDEGYRAEFIRLAEDAAVLIKSNEVASK